MEDSTIGALDDGEDEEEIAEVAVVGVGVVAAARPLLDAAIAATPIAVDACREATSEACGSLSIFLGCAI